MLSDWSLLRGTVPDGQVMAAQLTGVLDYAGNRMEPVLWDWVVDYAQDTTGPGVPKLVSYDTGLSQFDPFTEPENPHWRGYNSRAGNETEISVVPRSGDNGCLRIRKIGNGRRFGAYRNRGSLGLDTFPLLSFDYRIMPGTKINLALYIKREWYQITMTGSRQYVELGTIPEAAADGLWRHALVDLRQAIEEGLPDLRDPDVRIVAFADWGAPNQPGNTLYIDNVAFLGPASPLPLARYSAADATGISAYRVSFTTNPKDDPETEIAAGNSTVLLSAADRAAMWYIHARARDGAGNWGETLHVPYYCTEPIADTTEEGYEADGVWRASPSKRGSKAILYNAQGGQGNEFLGIQFVMAGSGTVEICRRGPLTLQASPVIEADLYIDSARDVELAACLRPVGGEGEMIVGGKMTISPGKWHRGVRLEFPEKSLAMARKRPGAKNIRSRDIGFVAYPDRKSRAVLLIDQVKIDGVLPRVP